MPMTRYEYLWLHKSDIHDGYIYIEIRKGMYRLSQVGLLAQDLLESCLKHHGYYQSHITPGLWLHKTRIIQFCLVIDDFGVKYTNGQDAKHLQTILTKYYEVSTDWTG